MNGRKRTVQIKFRVTEEEHGTVYNVEMQTTDNKKSAEKKQVLSRTDGYGCFEDRGRFCKAAAEYRDLYLHI